MLEINPERFCERLYIVDWNVLDGLCAISNSVN
jgi:hypothetical protein